MKQLIIALTLILTSTAAGYSQDKGDSYASQAAAALENKEYVKARYYYLKAYEAYEGAGKMAQAIPAAVNVAELYHREGYFKEAFGTLSAAEAALMAAEQTSEKTLPALHYPLAKERQKMYLKLRKADSAKEWLNRMSYWANAAADSALNVDLLSASANVYYTFGPTDKGDAAVNKLIALYQNKSDYASADKCYRDLIEMAGRTANPRLISRAYDKYIAWNDSISAVKEAASGAALQGELDAANTTIAERDSSLTAKTAIIVGLIILAGALAAALIFLAIATMRAIAKSRRLKKAIETARQHNELKSRFISNISAQMEPTLDTLPAGLPATGALKEFAAHIQQLSDLESTQTELYPTESVNMAEFCERVADSVRPALAEDVTLTVNAPKMNAPIAEEPLEHVLTHLLRNAAEYTPAGGKISLDFKKRGPHNIQFIVTDSGPGIEEESAATLFQPFATVRDLTGGDGLGLPICSLLAAKMNGTVKLDTAYTHGARFIVELHP